MNQQSAPVFVRVNKQNHPLQGMICILGEETDDGFVRVTVLKTSISAYFKPEDIQIISVGTRVIIEVEISDFFQHSMMVAGGWMSVNRILDIKEPKTSYVISQIINQHGEGAWGIFRYTPGQEKQLIEVKPTLREAKARSRELNG